MDALKELDPQTKMSELTVEQFEGVMTRTFCRVVEYAAVRFAQEAHYIQGMPMPTKIREDFLSERAEGAVQVREAIAGDDWPRFGVATWAPEEGSSKS